MIHIDKNSNGLTILIKAKPKSKQNAILGVRGEMLLVAITAPPEQGKANKAIIELLANELKLSKNQIDIISGQTHQQKVVQISGIERNELLKSLGLSERDLSC